MALGLQVSDEELKALLEVGYLHHERGEGQQAEEVFRGVLELRDLAVARVGLANALQIQGRDEEAEEVLRAAAERYPGEALVHQQLGELLHTRGKKEQALRALERAIELDPSGPAGAAARAVKELVEQGVAYTYRAPGSADQVRGARRCRRGLVPARSSPPAPRAVGGRWGGAVQAARVAG